MKTQQQKLTVSNSMKQARLCVRPAIAVVLSLVLFITTLVMPLACTGTEYFVQQPENRLQQCYR